MSQKPAFGLSISESKVLAVEGRDDQNFFEALVNHMNLPPIQVIAMEGRHPLQNKVVAIKSMPGFSEKVSSFGIAIDADADCHGAFDAVCGALRAAKLSIPQNPLQSVGDNPKVTVMTLPSCNSPGMLEDLCLKSVRLDSAMPCLQAFFGCLSSNGLIQRNNSKAKIHAFLATREISDLRLGEAAKKRYWPFDNEAFEEIKSFLRMI